MADLQRVSPRTIVESSLPFEIVLVAEGFLAGEEQAFSAMCDSLVDAFLGTPPFSLLNANPWRTRFWRHFSVGTHHGAALGSTPGDTLLGATYDQATQQLTFDQARVASFVGGTRIPMAPGLSLPLALVARDTWSHWGMMAVLLPPYAGTQRLTADADTSVLPAGATPPAKPCWFVATTLDDGWERVVIEAAARCLGLDDEWSRTEPAFAAPSASERLALCYSPNLFAGTPPTGVPTGAFPWNQELDAAALAKPLTVVPFGGVSPTPDEPIQLFEGAGRYRSGVYRSAADCFMRRRIGGGANSPRNDKVDFCVLCRRHLTRVVAATSPRWDGSSPELLFDQIASSGGGSVASGQRTAG